jgi:chromosome partitioning protein
MKSKPSRRGTTPSVAVISLKGGVGKTSVVLGLAGAATERGLRTLVIDMDPQANATASLDATLMPYSMSDVLYDARLGVARDALAESAWGPGVRVLPSERALEHRERLGGHDSAMRLRRATHGVVDEFDLVLIDCPPSLGELTRNALHAANLALVVTEPSFFAVAGAGQALEAIGIVSSGENPLLRVAGIVANKVRTSAPEHDYRLAELRDSFGELMLDSIPDRSAVQRAQGACVSVQKWESSGASDVNLAFDGLLHHLLVAHQAPAKTIQLNGQKIHAGGNDA